MSEANRTIEQRVERTRYSDELAGCKSNHGWAVRFDMTRGHLGITQWEGDSREYNREVKDRVLLSPAQVTELLRFLKVLA